MLVATEERITPWQVAKGENNRGKKTMSAVIIDLAAYRDSAERQPTHHLEQRHLETPVQAEGDRFQFWTGLSGRRYVHTVYSLLECPSLPACNYMLVKTGSGGERQIVEIGRATSDSSSLNLAEIRMKAARLGASEVHVHLLAKSAGDSRDLMHDLQNGLVSDSIELRRSGSLN